MNRRKFTETNEWVELGDNLATIGITERAVAEIGETVYVQLPTIGKVVRAAVDEIVVLESTKAAIDIMAPLSGEIVAVNAELLKDISCLNRSPEKTGWLIKLRPTQLEEFEALLEMPSSQ